MPALRRTVVPSSATSVASRAGSGPSTSLGAPEMAALFLALFSPDPCRGLAACSVPKLVQEPCLRLHIPVSANDGSLWARWSLRTGHAHRRLLSGEAIRENSNNGAAYRGDDWLGFGSVRRLRCNPVRRLSRRDRIEVLKFIPTTIGIHGIQQRTPHAYDEV